VSGAGAGLQEIGAERLLRENVGKGIQKKNPSRNEKFK